MLKKVTVAGVAGVGDGRGKLFNLLSLLCGPLAICENQELVMGSCENLIAEYLIYNTKWVLLHNISRSVHACMDPGERVRHRSRHGSNCLISMGY